MSELAALHKEIEKEGWDSDYWSGLNKRLQDQVEEFRQAGKPENARKLETERHALGFSKKPGEKKGQRLSPHIVGKVPTEQEKDEWSTVEWPDLQTWEEQDFHYLYGRFKDVENTFLRSEYGLFLFCADYLKDNWDIKELLESLEAQAEHHYESHHSKGNEERERFQLLTFTQVLRNALYVGRERKDEEEVFSVYQGLLRRVESAHGSIDVEDQEDRNYLLHLSETIFDFYKDAKLEVDIDALLERNWRGAEVYAREDPQKALDLGILSAKIAHEGGYREEERRWRYFQAEQKEVLAEQAKDGPRHLAAIHFMEEAYRLYCKLNDEEGMERTRLEYEDVRSRSQEHFGVIRQELSKEETPRILEELKKEASEGACEDVIRGVVLCPMFEPVNRIQEEVDEMQKSPPPQFLAGQTIMDKFGNTVAKYGSKSRDSMFWNNYELCFQLSEQMLRDYFVEGIKAGTITEEGVIRFLESTWLNEPLDPPPHQCFTVVPLDLLRPCMRTLFREFGYWMKDDQYEPDFVSLTDTLVLKGEAIIRYLCFRYGVRTFKTKNEVVMERSLEELLGELESLDEFSEDDRIFLKFLLTEQAGRNLRNRVAHGLLDAQEYSLGTTILAFTAIMRLSKY